MNQNKDSQQQQQEFIDSKAAAKADAKGLFASIKIFLVELLDFRHDTDREATISAIKADISFKGATAWILICSILLPLLDLMQTLLLLSLVRCLFIYGAHSWCWYVYRH